MIHGSTMCSLQVALLKAGAVQALADLIKRPQQQGGIGVPILRMAPRSFCAFLEADFARPLAIQEDRCAEPIWGPERCD